MVSEDVAKAFGAAIVQVLGVAYTYRPSLMVRRYLTKNLAAHHSSRYGNFSYFYKGDKFSILGSEEPLKLRTDPATGSLAQHWPEPELAILLGHNHEIVAYTLANDLTAIGIEARGRTEQQDGTYLGKVWEGSGSLGPRFVPVAAIPDPKHLTIGLSIKRKGRIIYDQQYSTSRCKNLFTSIPAAIVDCHRQFNDPVPLSKRIRVCPPWWLPAGTVVMLGTGLIVRKEYYCQPGDILTVYCAEIGELTNAVI